MATWEKTLERMRNNPQGDWTIGDLRSLAVRLGIEAKQPPGSHVTFSHSAVKTICTVPAARPIKPFYVKRFVDLVDEVLDSGGAP